MSDPLQPAELPIDSSDFTSAVSFGPSFVLDGADPPESVSEEDAEAAGDLDERSREDFIGLLYLGYLERECTVAGHRFVLHTPTHNERIERGALHREYLNSMNTTMMWMLLTVATYCTEIDDQKAPEPLNPKSAGVKDRLDWIKRTIFSTVLIEKLYEECLYLDARERAVVEYMDSQTKS